MQEAFTPPRQATPCACGTKGLAVGNYYRISRLPSFGQRGW